MITMVSIQTQAFLKNKFCRTLLFVDNFLDRETKNTIVYKKISVSPLLGVFEDITKVEEKNISRVTEKINLSNQTLFLVHM
jgi:hypothetical protein